MKKVIFMNFIHIQAVILLVMVIGPSHVQAMASPKSVFNITAGNGPWGTANDRMMVTPTVYSQGQVTIAGTSSCDLDLGNQTNFTDPTRDFLWEINTEVERYLGPRNGAKFHVVGIADLNSIGYSDLQGYSYSTDTINGSNNSSNQIPPGTVVAAITNEGRYSKFRIDVYGYNLTITWLTYNQLIYHNFLPLILRSHP